MLFTMIRRLERSLSVKFAEWSSSRVLTFCRHLASEVGTDVLDSPLGQALVAGDESAVRCEVEKELQVDSAAHVDALQQVLQTPPLFQLHAACVIFYGLAKRVHATPLLCHRQRAALAG
jgi:hypothetical protein